MLQGTFFYPNLNSLIIGFNVQFLLKNKQMHFNFNKLIISTLNTYNKYY